MIVVGVSEPVAMSRRQLSARSVRLAQMPRVYINGLFPGSPQPDGRGGMRVAVYLKQRGPRSPNKPVFQHWSNGRRFVDGSIDDKHVGKEVRIAITEPGFKYRYPEFKLQRLGLFHTAPLEKDTVYAQGMANHVEAFRDFDCQAEYTAAQKEMHSVVRQARYRNCGSIVAYVLLSFGAPFLGLVVAGLVGVFVGLIITGIAWFLSPYAAGLRDWGGD